MPGWWTRVGLERVLVGPLRLGCSWRIQTLKREVDSPTRLSQEWAARPPRGERSYARPRLMVRGVWLPERQKFLEVSSPICEERPEYVRIASAMIHPELKGQDWSRPEWSPHCWMLDMRRNLRGGVGLSLFHQSTQFGTRAMFPDCPASPSRRYVFRKRLPAPIAPAGCCAG